MLYGMLCKLWEKLCKSGFFPRPLHLTYTQPQTVWNATLPCLPNYLLLPPWVPESLWSFSSSFWVLSMRSGLWRGGNRRYQAVALLCRYILSALSSTPAKVSRALAMNLLALMQRADPPTERREQLTQRTLGTRRITWTHIALEAFWVQI